MSRLASAEVLPFLLMVATLLLSARLMGELFRKLKLPQVMGELVAGILLGPSCLSMLAPDFYKSFFVDPKNSSIAFDGLARIGILLLLFIAGMEINLKTIREKASAAATISLSGIAIPFFVGFTASWFLSSYLFPNGVGDKLTSSLFMGTALSITALSVLAKILIDIDMIKSKFGNLVMTAAMIDDFIGWMLFSLVVSVATAHGSEVKTDAAFEGWQVMMMVVGFAAFILTVGRKLIHQCFIFSNRYLSRGGGTLSIAIVLCLFGGVFTEWIGLHAIFGAFLVGIAVGDSEHFSHKNKEMLHDIVTYIFAPLFFVSIGFRVNFIKDFDFSIVLFVLIISIIGKMTGGYIGARLGRFNKNESIAIGFGMNSRGSQEIVLGLIALNAGIITNEVFVALVVMTFITIMMAGPAMKHYLNKKTSADSSFRDDAIA